MAYGEKYSIPFKNRQTTSCEVKILEKDYTYPSLELEGGDRPFYLSYQSQDNQIPYGIRASEATIEFWAAGLTLLDFYSEDDTHWKIEFYYAGVLAWSGFLQLDNCSDILQDTDHLISLNANDGLASLQNVYLLNDDGTPIIEDWTLAELLAYILPQTGLSIDTDAYLNIYENTTDDRTVHNYLTFLTETAISTKYYINDDGTTQSLYDILNNIIIDFRSDFFQANGVWNFRRSGDIRLFGDGLCPGTRYNSDFSSYQEIFYPETVAIGRREEGYLINPINENQESRILRPFQFSKETFSYNTPPLIQQATLQLPTGATPFATHTDGDLRYDDYDLSTYFPNWKEIGTPDTSFLEIVTDTSTPIDTETDRYIVSVFGNAVSGVRFNPIPVSKGDIIDFSLRFRTDTDVSGTLRFYANILLVTPDCTYYCISTPGTDTLSPPRWFLSVSPINPFFIEPDTSVDTTQWFDFDVNLADQPDQFNREVPADGIILIDIYGTNGASDHDDYTTYWKEVQLTIFQELNNFLQISGQFHNQSQPGGQKNNEQYEVTHDDSPRNSISGTLFTDAVTNFCEDIGDVYFTKTAAWHRADFDEARRLGELNTFNDLFIQRIPRTIMEGDFFGLTDISLLTILTWNKYPNKNFIFGIANFDYMSCVWSATLYELFDTGEDDSDLDNSDTFNYIYENTG